MTINDPQKSPPGDSTKWLLPSTPVQERCWFLNLLEPGMTALTIPLCFELRGHAPSRLIEKALQSVVDRHEALRTRLVAVDGVPMQEPLSSVTFKLTIVNLQMDGAEHRQLRANEILQSEIEAPFDLGVAPLMRATMIQMTEDSAILLVCVHQSVFDGSSITIFARDLGESIAALKAGVAPALPELPLQYGDYALWNRDFFAVADLSVEEAYWRRQLGDAPFFEVPADRPRAVPRTTDNGDYLSVMLEPALGKAFEEAPRTLGCSAFNFGSAVTAAMLARFTGQTDIILGTQLAGRNDADLENLIGAFINNLALRLDASGDPRFTEFLQRSAVTLSDAVAHQRLPFHRLVAALNPARDLSRTPIFSATVQVQNAFFDRARFGDIEMEARTTPMAGVFYDLAFFIVSRSAGWELKLEYNADVYNRETAEELMRLWRLTLEAVVADPNILLSALPAPTRAVRRPDAALAAIKAAIEAHPSIGECLLDRRGADLFAFVTPAPDRFEALEELPNALREHLTTQGVAPDALAGISVILALPRGANGAPDASRLPTPHRFQPKTATADPALSSARLELEARLARIWSDVLQTPGINAKSHFFDMGGHSMLAVQMIARVRDEFGLRIDPITLFKSPTLRAFAAHLDHEEAPDDDWRVLRLQTRGTKSPVIALNNPMIYHGLAKQIGSDRNFTVLQNYNAGTPQKLAPQKLEDIAAEYVKLVREHQPHGPYTLFGLCGAGMVAFEVAQQLKRSGEKVPLLVMADSFQPKLDRALGPIGRVRVALAERVHDFHLRYDRLRRKEVTLVEFLGSWGIVRRSGVLNLAKAIGLIDRIPVHHDDDDSRSRWFLPHILRARYHYEVGSYDGDILLLRSDEVPRNNKLFPEDFGWSGHVSGKLIVQDVPGLHMTMFNDPGASVVAKAVAPFLEAADELRGS